MKKAISLLLGITLMLSLSQGTVYAEDETIPGQDDNTQVTEEAEEVSEETEPEIVEETTEPKEENTAEEIAEEPEQAEPEIKEPSPAETVSEPRQNASDSKCGENLTWTYSNHILTISGTGDMYDYAPDDNPPWIEYENDIQTVKVGNGVTSIGDEAFYCFPSIKKVVLPDSIKRIGNFAFYGVFTDENADYEPFTLPADLEIVGDHAFHGDYCLPFTSSVLPGKLRQIQMYAFWNCDGLYGNLVIPEGVTEIGDFAFSECYYISSIKLPQSLQVIGRDSFSYLDDLIQITIPNNVTEIKSRAFCASGLEKVTIGKKVQTIGAYAFDTYFLQNVGFTGNAPQVGTKAFNNDNVTATYLWNNATWTDEEIEKIGKTFGSVTWKASIYGKKVVLSSTALTYNAKVQKPTVKTIDGQTLQEGVDYTVVYSDENSKNAGTYTVTVKGIGNYTSTAKATYTISPKTITPAVTLSATAYTYDGKVKKPTVTVKYGKTKLTYNTHYTVSFQSGRKNVGVYKVTVKLKGNYSGTKTVTFKINPKGTTISSLSAVSKGFTVNWNKQAAKMSTSVITGYQIQLATDSKFTKDKKTVTVSGYKNVSKTITGLTAKKKYYVRIRTYKTVSGTKYYSPWSAVKNVTTK